MTTIIILSLVGAIISAVVGTIWYSGSTSMGKIHMAYLGFDKLSDEEKKAKMVEAKPKMAKMYTAQILLSLLTSFAVVFIVSMFHKSGTTLGTSLGFIALDWLCFMVPIIGSGILWSNCDPKLAWKKFFSDSIENLVTLMIVALVASMFV